MVKTSYNITTHGDVVNTNGILSNFSKTNYATLPIKIPTSGVTQFELDLEFTTGSDVTTERCLISQTTDNWDGFKLDIVDGHLWIAGTSTNAYTSNYTFSINTLYYIRLVFDGTGYNLYISTDGKNYNTQESFGDGVFKTQPNKDLYLGSMYVSDSRYFNGTINLSGCNLIINNQLVWRGVTTTNVTRIVNRHDTAANWTSVNPVLAAGEMGVETDTNKFKFGDGTTAWSELEYTGAGIDLSNYYTKTEADNLLNGKEDSFTPSLPLKIEAHYNIPAKGITISDNSISTISANHITIRSYIQTPSTTKRLKIECPDATIAKNVLAGNYPSYIDMPFTYGKTIKFDADKTAALDETTTNSRGEWNVILGKKVKETFIPLIFCNYLNNGWISLAIIDNTSGIVEGSSVYYNVTYVKGSVGSEPGSKSNVPHLLITQNGTSRILNFTQPRNTVIQFVNSSINDTTAVAALDDVTVVRVIPKTTPVALTSYGIYSDVSATNLDSTTWGTNEFDISSVTEYKYLKLALGTGLDVVEGKLTATGSSGGGSGTQLTSADGTTEYGELALGDTLAVSDGVLNANLDSKQDKLTSGKGISINTVLEGSMTPDWYLNGAKLDPVPDTINTPASGVTNTYQPYNSQTFSNTVDNINIIWETLYAYTSSMTNSTIKLVGTDRELHLRFDGNQNGGDTVFFGIWTIVDGSGVLIKKISLPSYKKNVYFRNIFSFDKVTNTWKYECVNTNTGETIKLDTGTTSSNIIPTDAVVNIFMDNNPDYPGAVDDIRIKTATFSVASSTKEVTKITAKPDNTTIGFNSSGQLACTSNMLSDSNFISFCTANADAIKAALGLS